MYDEDAETWRAGFRFRLPSLHSLPWNLIAAAGIVFLSWRLGRLIHSMKIRLETLEAILLDHPPRV